MVGMSETFGKGETLYWKPMSTVDWLTDWLTVALEKEKEEEEEEDKKNKMKIKQQQEEKNSNEVSCLPGCYALSTGKYLDNLPP